MNAPITVKDALPAELGQATINPEQYAAAVIAPFQSALEAAIAEDVTDYDVTTTAGMKLATARRAVFREIRIGTDKERAARKAPLLEIGRLLDAKAKELVALVSPHEDRHDAAIKAEEARKAAEKAEKERIERERIAVIQERIQNISNVPGIATGKPSASMQATLDILNGIEVTLDEFAEFAGTAMQAKQRAVEQLELMIESMKAQEDEAARIKAEREEFELQQEIERKRLLEERAALARQQAEAEQARKLAEAEAVAAQAERDRIAAEERAAAQAKLDAQTAELRRQQDACRAEQEAARMAAEPAQPEQEPEAEVADIPEPLEPELFELQQPALVNKRPSNEQLVMAVADLFTVTDDVAYQWLMEFATQTQEAA